VYRKKRSLSPLGAFSRQFESPAIPTPIRSNKQVINRLREEYPTQAIRQIEVTANKKRSNSVGTKAYEIVLSPRMSQFVKTDSHVQQNATSTFDKFYERKLLNDKITALEIENH